jgi:hypothetical protein
MKSSMIKKLLKENIPNTIDITVNAKNILTIKEIY